MMRTVLDVLMMALLICNLWILWHLWGRRLWAIRCVRSELRKINRPSDLFAGYGLIDNLAIKIDSHNSLYMRVENAPEFNVETRRILQDEILESREYIEREYNKICVGRSVILERMSDIVERCQASESTRSRGGCGSHSDSSDSSDYDSSSNDSGGSSSD